MFVVVFGCLQDSLTLICIVVSLDTFGCGTVFLIVGAFWPKYLLEKIQAAKGPSMYNLPFQEALSPGRMPVSSPWKGRLLVDGP
jgi:succinate-acetate transporter protein